MRFEVKFDSTSRGVSTAVDSLAATMDRRFDEVAVALGEQRRYTDFAYERLDDVDGCNSPSSRREMR